MQLLLKILSDRRVQVSLALCFVLGTLLLFYNHEDENVSFSQYREVLQDNNRKPSPMITPAALHPVKEKAKAEKRPAIRNIDFDQALLNAQQANKRCESAFRKLLPNKKWPAPFGPAYSEIQDLKALLTVGLGPSIAKEDQQVILLIGAELARERAIEPERAQKLLHLFWELESCRGRDLATVLDAVLELARKNKALKNYQESDTRALVAQLWRTLVSAQQGYYTPTDLLFLSGFWMKAQAQDLIGITHRSDLLALVEKITNTLHEEDIRLPVSGAPPTAGKLLEFYRDIQILGHDLEEFGKEVMLDN